MNQSKSSLAEVVVIDDDPGVRRSLNLLLSGEYRVATCPNGEKGLEEIGSHTHAVILDIQMADRDGFEICKDIQANFPNLPIIFYTGHPDTKDPVDVINDHHPFAFIQKADASHDILQTVRDAVTSSIKGGRLAEDLLYLAGEVDADLYVEHLTQILCDHLQVAECSIGLIESGKFQLLSQWSERTGFELRPETAPKFDFNDQFVQAIKSPEWVPRQSGGSYIFPLLDRDLLGGLYLRFSTTITPEIDLALSRLTHVSNQIASGLRQTINYQNLSKNLEETYDELRSAKDVLLTHNKTLSKHRKEARDSRRNLQDILDNTAEGFLTFNNKLIVGQDYSKTIVHFFGKIPSGLHLSDILNISDSEMDVMQDALEMESLDGDLIFELFPDRVEIEGKVLGLDFTVIAKRGPNRLYLMMVTDITEKLRLEAAHEHDEELQKILVLCAQNRNDFIKFEHDFGVMISRVRALMDQPLGGSEINEMFRLLHTVKGNAATFSMKQIANAAQDFEEDLARLRSGEIKVSDELLTEFKSHQAKIENGYEVLTQEILELLNIEKQEIDCVMKSYDVPAHKIKETLDLIDKLNLGPDKPKLKAAIKSLCSQPIQKAFARTSQVMDELASRLDKQIHPLQIVGGDIEVDHEKIEPVVRNFVHLIRNALDHGIEAPEQRREKGKPEEGNIKLTFRMENKFLAICLADDGNGIDPQKVRQKAIEKRILTQAAAEKLDDSQAMKLIFEPNFSTAEQITDISGRGVGLDALMADIQEMGGDIKVESTLGKGSVFQIEIPI